MGTGQPHIIEACVETIQESILAQQNGATQVEYCAALNKDGLTPPLNQIEKLVKIIEIPTKVMIRSRPGNFIYSEDEVAEMIRTINQFKSAGISGFVFGALTPENEIDVQITRLIAGEAFPIPVTFHKAIDLTPDILTAIDTLEDIPNIEYVLSSGTKETAAEGSAILTSMINRSKQLKIIAAGRITSANLDDIARSIPAWGFHGRRIVDR